jgi:hypothetical protein
MLVNSNKGEKKKERMGTVGEGGGPAWHTATGEVGRRLTVLQDSRVR